MKHNFKMLRFVGIVVLMMTVPTAYAANATSFGFGDLLTPGLAKSGDISTALRILILLTILSLIPTLLIATTSFLRIIVVLSMLRHAIGMQDTPPNSALISIALFLTLFSMQPVLGEINKNAWRPFHENKISINAALTEAIKPMRDFMIRQTREPDLALMVELSGASQPSTVDDVGIMQLIPAFM